MKNYFSRTNPHSQMRSGESGRILGAEFKADNSGFSSEYPLSSVF